MELYEVNEREREMDRCVLIVIINPEVKKESTFSGKKLALVS